MGLDVYGNFSSEELVELVSLENFEKRRRKNNATNKLVSNTWLIYSYFDLLSKLLPEKHVVTQNDLEQIVRFSELNSVRLFYDTLNMLDQHRPKGFIIWRLKRQINKQLSTKWIKHYSVDFAEEIYYSALRRRYKVVSGRY